MSPRPPLRQLRKRAGCANVAACPTEEPSMRPQFSRLSLAAGVACALISPAALAQVPAPALPVAPTAPVTIKPIKPDLYMVTGAGGNTTVRVTSAGLIVVDGKNPGQQIYDDLMAQIRTVSQAPVTM